MNTETTKTKNTCPGFCGMNYCDEHGCIDAKPDEPNELAEPYDWNEAVDLNYNNMFRALFIVFALFVIITLLSYLYCK